MQGSLLRPGLLSCLGDETADAERRYTLGQSGAPLDDQPPTIAVATESGGRDVGMSWRGEPSGIGDPGGDEADGEE